MIRTFEALRAVEPGFTEPESLQTFRIGVPPQLVPDAQAVWRLQQNIVAALEAVPGVESAAFTNALPMEQVVTNWDGIEVEGGENNLDSMALRVFNTISPGYLPTMGMSLAAGRNLTFEDVDGLRPVALVSETLARELWQTPEAALGHRIRTAGGGPWREVIGVVADVRLNGLDRGSPATVYWPTLMADFYRGLPFYVDRGVAFAVRSPAGRIARPHAADRASRLVRERELARRGRADDAGHLRPLARPHVVHARDAARRCGRRARARRRRLVRRAVVRGVDAAPRDRDSVRAGRQTRRRAAADRRSRRRARRHRRRIGLVAAAGVTRLMASLLYDVQAVDPLTYAAVAAGLIAVAALASYLPARRASAVDPAESLAAE